MLGESVICHFSLFDFFILRGQAKIPLLFCYNNQNMLAQTQARTTHVHHAVRILTSLLFPFPIPSIFHFRSAPNVSVGESGFRSLNTKVEQRQLTSSSTSSDQSSTMAEDGECILGLSSEERSRIMADTRFTAMEIDELWYRIGAQPTVDRSNFEEVLSSKSGIRDSVLVERLWDVFDRNDDGDVETVEFIISMGKLTKGTLDETVDIFFELYDKDSDQQLSEDEIVSVYCSLLFSSYENDVSRTTQWTDEQKEEEEQRVRAITKEILAEQDVDKDGTLNKNEFRSLVKDIYEKDQQKSGVKGNKAAAYLTTAFLVFVVSFAELGTSFAVQNVGALSGAFKDRFNADDGDIGLFTGMYYISAAFGAVAFGIMLDAKGAPLTLLASNSVVLFGCIVQAIAASFYPNFILLCIARFIIGIGGEATMFSSVESLSYLFPDYFTLMAGYRNLVQSSFGFLAFSTLPTIQEGFQRSDDSPAEEGLGETMWVICLFVGVSIVSNIVVCSYIRRSNAKSKDEANRINIAKALRSWTADLTPKIPRKCGDWVMPLGFYFSIYAIQSFYFALFSFTAFSVKIFSERNGLGVKEAAFMSGLPSLIAGIMGPLTAPLTDILGKRSILLSLSLMPTTIGFLILVFSSSAGAVYAFVGLSSIAYGIGDTVAYISIRMLVGAERAGKGYAIQALGGNILSFVVPAAGGYIINRSGDTAVLWYFVILHVVGSLSWLCVRLTVDSKSPLELPAKDLIETSDEQINAAALHSKFASTPDPRSASNDQQAPSSTPPETTSTSTHSQQAAPPPQDVEPETTTTTAPATTPDQVTGPPYPQYDI